MDAPQLFFLASMRNQLPRFSHLVIEEKSAKRPRIMSLARYISQIARIVGSPSS